MKKIAVVYRSKSGFTTKYANWISKTIGGDLLHGKETKIEDLLGYDVIIYGGGIYAGGVNGLKLITGNYEKLKGKKLIVFGLGASPVRPEIYEEVKNRNLTKEQQERIAFFLLRGGFDNSKLTFVDKILMQGMKIYLKRKKEPTDDDRDMLNAYARPVDYTDKKYIEPIINEVINI
ncbi:MAG: flavodoxin domain-containing protein [Eubacteriales bacterium]|nr:flavodoxin domain-containing protein [Eubacteriales bacterium]